MNVRTPLCDTELRESAVWPITPNSKFVCVRVCVCVCVSVTCNWALWRSVSLCSYSPLLVVVVFFPTYIFFLVFQNGLPALLLLSAGWSEAGILINQTLRTWNGHYPLCVCCHSAVLSSAPPPSTSICLCLRNIGKGDLRCWKTPAALVFVALTFIAMSLGRYRCVSLLGLDGKSLH